MRLSESVPQLAASGHGHRTRTLAAWERMMKPYGLSASSQGTAHQGRAPCHCGSGPAIKLMLGSAAAPSSKLRARPGRPFYNAPSCYHCCQFCIQLTSETGQESWDGMYPMPKVQPGTCQSPTLPGYFRVYGLVRSSELGPNCIRGCLKLPEHAARM